MTERLDVAIIGAGPYGLSVAAQLRDRAAAVRTFGSPMQTWRTRMPPDMRLRSDWDETSFSAPGGQGRFDDWAAATGESREEPIPLQKFLRYADWFRTTMVGEMDESDIARVERSNGEFRLTTQRGDELAAGMVVLAVGAVPSRCRTGAACGGARQGGRRRDRPPGLQPLSVAQGRGRRRWSGRPGKRASWRRARAPTSSSSSGRTSILVHGPRATQPAQSSRTAPLPPGLSRRRLRAATAQPSRPSSRPLRATPARAPPQVDRACPPRRRIAVVARSRRELGPGQAGRGGRGPRTTQRIPPPAAQRRRRTRRRRGDRRCRLPLRIGPAGVPFAGRASRGPARRRMGRVLDRWFRSTDPRLLFAGFPSERRFGPIVRFIPGTRFCAPRIAELLSG